MQVLKRHEIESVGEGSHDSLSLSGGLSVEGSDSLQASLESIADTFDVTGFKCPHGDCGLVHSHDTTKHRLSDSYDISEDTASDGEYNSVCHCGLHEAARRGADFGIDERDAASKSSNAPIPPEVTRKMNEKFGGI